MVFLFWIDRDCSDLKILTEISDKCTPGGFLGRQTLTICFIVSSCQNGELESKRI